jgi:hypothetical protein
LGWSWDNSVCIVTDYWLDVLVSIPDKGKEFLSFSKRSDQFLGPPSPISRAYPELKRSMHEADHSPPSGAEARSNGAVLQLPCTSSWCSA